MNYKIEVAYDGSRYKGWQKLGNSINTIQEKIESVLEQFADRKVEIHGSGRTDAGVHALAQTASFKLNKNVEPAELKAYLNRYLPDDIAINEVTLEEERFHARYNAVTKVYRYQIFQSDVMDPFLRKYFLFLNDSLDIELMKRGASDLIGEHDFTAFTTAKSKKKSFVRDIKKIDIIVDENKIYFEIEGNGFLHNMVRIIVGTLIEIGLGKMKYSQISHLLNTGDRTLTGPTAPSHGLFLKQVNY